ncbi:hypothetical protein [Streptosporangium sp. NPDC051022]|uniref:hypothetical protein n=1 Tax=Streptosporangium sp. NPDC051022 TaxID=3155752 RepID=UPI00341DA9BC
MSTRRRTSTSTLLAGWLFADLLLGVTIIMLGAQAPAPSHADALAEAARTLPETVRPLPDATRSPGEGEESPEDRNGQEAGDSRETGGPSRETEKPQQSGESQQGGPRKAEETQEAGKPREAGEPREGGESREAGEPSPAESPGPVEDSGRKSTETDPTPAEPSPSTSAPSPVSSTSSTSSTSSAEPSPTPSPCDDRLGDVQAKPITIAFQVPPAVGDGTLAVQVRQELLKHRDRLAGQHAGMVLTFGADGGAGEGVRLATRVNTAIREAYPRIFGTAVTRNFHDLSAPPGSISMEIYLMTYGCSRAPEQARPNAR